MSTMTFSSCQAVTACELLVEVLRNSIIIMQGYVLFCMGHKWALLGTVIPAVEDHV